MIAKDAAICIIELICVSRHFWPNQLSYNLKIKIPKNKQPGKYSSKSASHTKFIYPTSQ